MRMLIILALMLPALVQGGTLYRSVTPDGRILYSDQPPESGKVERTFNFANLPASPVPESVTQYRADLEKSVQKKLSGAADAKQPVLYMAKWCGYCRQAEAYLAEKKISYQRHDIDTPDGKRAYAEATGAGKGIPLIHVGTQKVRGYSRPAYEALFATTR